MEFQKNKRKKNYKPLYILLGFIVFFIAFISILLRPSLQSQAIDELQVCNNVSDVKSVFDKYKFELLENDINGNKIVSDEFQLAVRKRLDSFNLTEDEIMSCLEWLPPNKTNLNIIVIPDLSRRITDTFNNPDQIQNDIYVLKTIWKSFVEYAQLKQDTKDKLMVDVTDIDQAKGQFGKIADQLYFDLSKHQGKSNRLYFTADKNKQFENSILELYNSAKEKPLGADYPFYFRRYLTNHLKKPTLFENYRNKIIIITDGYLEAENKPAYTKIFGDNYDYRPQLYPAVDIGNVMEVITNKQLNIPKINGVDLADSDILICEVNERKVGKTKDFEILKVYWTDWLKRMNADKVVFIQREQSNQLTRDKIEQFIKN
jgi:hypothetical protein